MALIVKSQAEDCTGNALEKTIVVSFYFRLCASGLNCINSLSRNKLHPVDHDNHQFNPLAGTNQNRIYP